METVKFEHNFLPPPGRSNQGEGENHFQEGKLKEEGVKPGFVITQVNNKPVNTVDELDQIFKSLKGGVYIEGVYQDGVVAYYAFGL